MRLFKLLLILICICYSGNNYAMNKNEQKLNKKLSQANELLENCKAINLNLVAGIASNIPIEIVSNIINNNEATAKINNCIVSMQQTKYQLNKNILEANNLVKSVIKDNTTKNSTIECKATELQKKIDFVLLGQNNLTEKDVHTIVAKMYPNRYIKTPLTITYNTI